MDEFERTNLETRVQNRIGPIRNVKEIPDWQLVQLESPNPDLSVLDRPAPEWGVMPDTRPLHEQLFGFRLF